MALDSLNIQEDNKYFSESLKYYLYLELGTKQDFEKEIKEHGEDYYKYYYNESYNDSYYQSLNGNIFYPSSI